MSRRMHSWTLGGSYAPVFHDDEYFILGYEYFIFLLVKTTIALVSWPV